MMKRFLFLTLLLLLLAGCAQSQAPAEVPAETPAVQEAPAETQEETTAEEPESIPLGSFEAQTLTNETLTEDYFSNADLTVINVWATFCGPCKEEMPVLAQLDQELEHVQILGIVTDVIDQSGSPDSAQVELALELAELAGCQYPNLILNESLAMLGFASLSAVPATWFVDGNGNLVGQGFYGALSEEGWRSIIAERLELAKS